MLRRRHVFHADITLRRHAAAILFRFFIFADFFAAPLLLPPDHRPYAAMLFTLRAMPRHARAALLLRALSARRCAYHTLII